MKKVIFKDLQDKEIASKFFDTLEQAQEWINERLAREYNLGKRASYWSEIELEGAETREVVIRPLIPAQIEQVLEDGTVIPAQDEIPAITKLEYFHPAEYTYEIVDDFSQEIQELYNKMNTEVYSQMEVVFGTTKSDSAQATKDTWELMLSKPELFAATLSMTNEQAIAYAQSKFAAVEQYAVWRMQRIAQFQAAKAALLAGV